MKTDVLTIVSAIDAAQRADGVRGSVAEIGVHHGKLFIGLQLAQGGRGTSVAIDVFGDQDLNIDGSGRGDRERFIQNVERWSSTAGLVVHQGDSTLLQPAKLVELAGGPIRLISVDGGHTEQIVSSDMRLAEATLATGGVVIADDVFNAAWPGVVVGTLRYLADGGGLVPSVIGFNKVLFSQPEFSERYRDAVAMAFSERSLIQVRPTVFAGHDVIVIEPVAATPRRLLRRNRVARSVYRMVRGKETVSAAATETG